MRALWQSRRPYQGMMLALAGLLLGLGLCFAAPVAGLADETSAPSAADKAAIRQVIEGQIAAFQRDDGEAAFGFASPSARMIFGSAEHFMEIVRRGYQAVYRPRSVQFGATEEVDGLPIQHVLVVAPDNVVVDAVYIMARQPDGTWRINGCILTESEQKST